MDNYKQIWKTNNKTKLIEFNDELQFNDFKSNGYNIKSTVHNKFSRIRVTIVDWTNGKKEKTNVINYLLLPSKMKLISDRILTKDIDFFSKVDNYTKKAGYYEQKINPHQKDANGNSPVSCINIYYQEKMRSPWTINIEEGVGKVGKNNNTGGIIVQPQTYNRIANSTLYITDSEILDGMIQIKDYINTFETVSMNKMLKARAEYVNTRIKNNAN
ncbi:MAG: hypothetical protein ACOCRX_00825 [Candidatus Woesearchaeota archaeon]